ncbi:MAG: hypothetical protein IGS50_15365 [Synechococcales cyanobacterium C42_A2020_086]|jgi:general stress protein YciG|nr:hypothetical protein [Synechococcales cyanobacterium C42_A2020_086]
MATKQNKKQDPNEPETKGKQGFAAMDEETRKEAASKGGRASRKDGSESVEEAEKAESQASKKSAADESELETEGEDLDELLELLEEEELTDLDPDEAMELIDDWQGMLSKSKDEELSAIGANLKQLKKLLSSSKTKPTDLAELLTQLGEQTDEYANHAERGYKTKLHKLGKSLNKAGKSLQQELEQEDEA